MESTVSSHTAFIRMQGICKYFKKVVANDHVDMDINRGEILGILGENGAGKTTLMNILYGLYSPDEGTISLDGREVEIDSPKDAIDLGIGMVHQHFMLVPRHSVIENMILGKPEQKGRLKLRSAKKEIQELAQKFGFDIPLDTLVKDLSVGVQQKVEILKAIYRGAELLIMDEPTAVLTPQETDELFSILRTFVQDGNTVVLITHKLNEVMAITDRVSVLRDAKNVGEVTTKEVEKEQLSKMMVGRDISVDEKRERGASGGETSVVVEDVSVKGPFGRKVLKTLSFEVRKGEIFGIAGVTGNGQEPLANMFSGLESIESGKILLNERDITNMEVNDTIKSGIAFIPADRQRTALVLDMPLKENLLLKNYHKAPFATRGVMHGKVGYSHAQKLMEDYRIKAESPETHTRTLSGGHQQRVVVARELSLDPDFIVAFQPTRGLDIGAIEYVHDVLMRTREEGKSILLISTELSEIFALSDRIGVLYQGELLATLPVEEATVEQVGLLMAGIKEEE